MMKAVGAATACQPMGASRGQQSMRTDKVGFDKGIGARNRSIDVALGSKVHQGIDVIICQGLMDQHTVADITLYKMQLPCCL